MGIYWKAKTKHEICSACSDFESYEDPPKLPNKTLCVAVPAAGMYQEETTYLCEHCLEKSLLAIRQARLDTLIALEANKAEKNAECFFFGECEK